MIAHAAIRELKTRLSGQLLVPGDGGYDAARSVFNTQIDRRPALIAQCGSAGDVVSALDFARAQNLLLSVKCTGHNVAGFAVCDDGIVIDLSPMKQIVVDPSARTARVGAGCTWGEVNDALQPHGLAAAGGFVSITGVSGLTLGGGLGWLVRKHGLALDNMISARVVLADGRIVGASATENDDLFWALRGGGGNFGIVTEFEFTVHPAGTVLGGVVVHPFAAARAALRKWRDFEKTTPEEFSGARSSCTFRRTLRRLKRFAAPRSSALVVSTPALDRTPSGRSRRCERMGRRSPTCFSPRHTPRFSGWPTSRFRRECTTTGSPAI